MKKTIDLHIPFGFRLDDEIEHMVVSTLQLPKHARHPDYIGITNDGKFEFNREAYLKFLEKIEKRHRGER